MPRRKKAVEQHAGVQGDDGTLTVLDGVFSEEGASDAVIETDVPQRGSSKRLVDRVKDALFGDGDDEPDIPPAKRASASKARQAEMADSFATMTALVLCWLLQKPLAPEFKECGPTFPESHAIMIPVGRILARRIKKAGKLTEDTLDLMVMVSAIGMYGIRANETYQGIAQKLVESEHHGNTHTTRQARPDVGRAGTSVVGPEGHAAVRPSSDRGHAGEDTGEQRRETSVMDELLRADADGRSQRGLL